MSIFGKIKDAIFGNRGPMGGDYFGKDTRPQATAPAGSGTAPAQPQATPTPQSAPAPAAAPAASGQQAAVDVGAVLTEMARANGSNLNWQSSIVDLMKLLGLDPSLHNREELAGELGYTGAKDGSAEMNIWLHKAVMQELAKNGGIVPAHLAD